MMVSIFSGGIRKLSDLNTVIRKERKGLFNKVAPSGKD